MNERTLTVKGIGNLKTAPDLVIITMNLTTTTPDYERTTECATLDIESIRKAIISVGYDKQALKTTDFKIKAEYESVKDAAGNWKRKFEGYSCIHHLKLEFDLDMKRLGETILAIAQCGANPEFDINFSIKDKAAVQAELLEKAVANATEKAAILAKASGVSLGAVKHIDYSWGELRLYSNTRFVESAIMEAPAAFGMEIEPEDVEVNDTVTVIWGIE
ncbi:MAG TPA: SIMPL domain-containing protein [Ruminococcaceae bacterium]|nr:SIMPL domain-containing protein [Oscillospiraceae bacterium]